MSFYISIWDIKKSDFKIVGFRILSKLFYFKVLGQT